ncbi:unnamed protein product [Mycena citricolor]|uniref:Uncharacterized protein n=1 Tax=Mycena citricolor TaxID=2018698 RepID=A0AAD2GSR9_9AGAR|nr:unnamed protein product [Mycena citricolor]
MRCSSTLLAIALAFSSMAAAAPVTLEAPFSETSAVSTSAAPAADSVVLSSQEQQQQPIPSAVHGSDAFHLAEKSRRRSFRRRHP